MSQQFYNLYHQWNLNRGAKKIISQNNFTYFYTLRLLSRVLALLKKKQLQILDVGCGVGTIDLYLAKLGHQVTGIDISSDAIKLAKQTQKEVGLKVDFQVEDVAKLKAANKFDLVICSEVIEHVPDDKKLLKDIFRVLKPGGVLLLTTPSLNAPLYRLGLVKEFDQKVGHLRRYEMNSLQSQIKASGFEIRYSEKNESILRNVLFMNPVLGKTIRFIRGPLVPMFHVIDGVLTTVVGESDLAIIAQKK